MSEVTRILDRVRQGDANAAEELLPLVYEELRRLAAHKMANEQPGQTLQPTALVHEAWLRLAGEESRRFENRSHFFAAAAEAMRRILIDRARSRRSGRRGGGQPASDVHAAEIPAAEPDAELLAVNEAVERLGAEDPGAAQVVKLRYFVGMTVPEAAAALGLAPRTAERLWAYARAWLHRELQRRS